MAVPGSIYVPSFTHIQNRYHSGQDDHVPDHFDTCFLFEEALPPFHLNSEHVRDVF